MKIMTESTKKWYVVRAISGKERRVKELIEYEMEHSSMKNHVEQVLIPQEKIY